MWAAEEEAVARGRIWGRCLLLVDGSFVLACPLTWLNRPVKAALGRGIALVVPGPLSFAQGRFRLQVEVDVTVSLSGLCPMHRRHWCSVIAVQSLRPPSMQARPHFSSGCTGRWIGGPGTSWPDSTRGRLRSGLPAPIDDEAGRREG